MSKVNTWCDWMEAFMNQDTRELVLTLKPQVLMQGQNPRNNPTTTTTARTNVRIGGHRRGGNRRGGNRRGGVITSNALANALAML